MARITVEDCLEKLPNRFKLVMLAAQRARQIAMLGEEPLVEIENDKSTVIALREIAAGLIDTDKVIQIDERRKAALEAADIAAAIAREAAANSQEQS